MPKDGTAHFLVPNKRPKIKENLQMNRYAKAGIATSVCKLDSTKELIRVVSTWAICDT